MRFALLGSHPDGLAMAGALEQTGRHELTAYTTPAAAGQVLRAVGGEIAEIAGFAAHEDLEADEPFLLSGRFEQGALFQASFLPHQQEPRWRLTAVGRRTRAELVFPLGRPGPAFLSWRNGDGELREE